MELDLDIFFAFLKQFNFYGVCDEFNKILSFFVNNVNAEKATGLQLINYREMTQDTLKFI